MRPNFTPFFGGVGVTGNENAHDDLTLPVFQYPAAIHLIHMAHQASADNEPFI